MKFNAKIRIIRHRRKVDWKFRLPNADDKRIPTKQTTGPKHVDPWNLAHANFTIKMQTHFQRLCIQRA
jgi:hypothetical protein